MGWYDRKVCRVRDLSCGDTRILLELEVRRLDCRSCGKVKRERLDFLADNPHYTKRFAYYVGRRCRAATIKDVAADLKLDWHTVKTLDQQYMQAQLARVGRPGPQVIGVDEIAIRKGHTYRIVVSDLLRGRPIWFGGKDRSQASMSEFYVWLGAKKSGRIRLAVMDMWRPFRLATAAHAPNAAILFDKFHVMRRFRKLPRPCRYRKTIVKIKQLALLDYCNSLWPMYLVLMNQPNDRPTGPWLDGDVDDLRDTLDIITDPQGTDELHTVQSDAIFSKWHRRQRGVCSLDGRASAFHRPRDRRRRSRCFRVEAGVA